MVAELRTRNYSLTALVEADEEVEPVDEEVELTKLFKSFLTRFIKMARIKNISEKLEMNFWVEFILEKIRKGRHGSIIN